MEEDIQSYLPHRYPFLFIDKIVSIDAENKSGVFQKNISNNENYFVGHFPDFKVMPGVIQVEAMAQAFIILLKKLGYKFDTLLFAKINEAVFKKMVRPGDILFLKVKLVKEKMGVFVGDGVLENQDGEIVAFGKMTAASIVK